MRALIRHLKSGLFYTKGGRWTVKRERALDFVTREKACDFVTNFQAVAFAGDDLRGVEVVMTGQPQVRPEVRSGA